MDGCQCKGNENFIITRETLLSEKDEEIIMIVWSEIDEEINIMLSDFNKILKPTPSQQLLQQINNQDEDIHISQSNNIKSEQQSFITDIISQNEYAIQDNYPITSDHQLPKQYNSSVLICINSCYLNLNLNFEQNQAMNLIEKLQSQIQTTNAQSEIGSEFQAHRINTEQNKQESIHLNDHTTVYHSAESNFCKLSKILCGGQPKDIMLKQQCEKQSLLKQIEKQFKLQKEGSILYFQGNSNKEQGNLIFYSDLEFQNEIFQISCEEIIQQWNKRCKKQKLLLLLLDSQYTWQWISKIKAINDLTIIIQTIKGLDLQTPKGEQNFKSGEFSENLIKVLTNSKQKLQNHKYNHPLFFGYNNPFKTYEVLGLPIFYFCFSQMVYAKDTMNIMDYYTEVAEEGNNHSISVIKSEIGETAILQEIRKYVGFINQDGIKHKFGSAVYKNKDFYLGEWQTEQKCGLGIQYFECGTRIYFGRFEYDQFQGEGLLLNNDGSYYLGNFDKGKQNGAGNMYYSNGESYHGDFLNNKRHGYGEEKMIDSKTFKGQYQNDYKNGNGVVENAEGIVIYIGTFVDGLRSGHGKEIYDREGKIFYKGEWKNNLKNGAGIEWYSNGAYFQGQFVDNLKEEIGKYIYSNGCVFEGKFHLDMRNGYGVFNDINGLRYEGLWINNQEEGQFKVYKNNELIQQLLYIRGVPKQQRIQKNGADFISPQLTTSVTKIN